MTFTAAVIGLGNIGQGFDYDCSDSSRVLTHAAAFHYHPDFELLAGVDPDDGARRRFAAKFRKPAFASLADLYRSANPDVLSICVPTLLHCAVFDEVVVHSPRAIVCEKPLAVTLEEARAMDSAARRAGALLLVNYMRRFEPGVLQLKTRIEAGEFGRFYRGVQWYSKGLLTNGSHFLDLLVFLFGPVVHVELLRRGRRYGDFDREPDVRLSFGELEVYMLAAREEAFSMRDLQLLSERAEVRYCLGGEEILVRKTRPHPFVAGYTVLEERGEPIPSDLRRYQFHVVAALHRALTAGEALNSNSATAVETMRVIQQIMDLHREVAHA